jgi:hypothetical protein
MNGSHVDGIDLKTKFRCWHLRYSNSRTQASSSQLAQAKLNLVAKVTYDAGRLDSALSALPLPSECLQERTQLRNHSRIQKPV